MIYFHILPGADLDNCINFSIIYLFFCNLRAPLRILQKNRHTSGLNLDKVHMV
jgi:hypothetical protein